MEEVVKDAELDLYPFKIVRNETGYPVLEVEVKGAKKQYTPEEVSAFVLRQVMVIVYICHAF